MAARGPELWTDRLHLIAADAQIARADASDRARLARLLDARVPPEWPPELFGEHVEMFADQLEAHPDQTGWWAWYWILRGGHGAHDARTLIGSGGFAGPPSGDGALMIGYSLAAPFQGRGYASEAVRALLRWAFQRPGVDRISGDTLAHLAASVRVMERAGMRCIGPGDEGGVIRFAITRREHATRGT